MTLVLLLACVPEPGHTGAAPDLFQVSPTPGSIEFVEGQTFLVVLSSQSDPHGSWLVDGAAAAGKTLDEEGNLYGYQFSSDPVPQASVEFAYDGGSVIWTAAEP